MSNEFPILPISNELELIGGESDCSYLPGQTSQMQYRIAMSLAPERYEQLLERGWRRFGRTLFRPICAACNECQSLRVDIPAFRPSKSQRRSRNRNADVDLIIASPSVRSEYLELYNVYHRDMHDRRGWPYREITEDQYFESFVDGDFSFAREFQYRLNGRLVGLGLVDLTPRFMSSIYFIHAPDLRNRALGTMSVLRELEVGQDSGRRWHYMGYFIRDCGSMNYKNRYLPHQLMNDYVADNEVPSWQIGNA